MKIDKYSIMEILQERSIVTYDKDNYQDIKAEFRIEGQPPTPGKIIKYILVTIDGTYERISWHNYIKKSRDSRINRIIDNK